MLHVFCDTTDLPALWAAGGLRARGLATQIVTAPVLESALFWRHIITAEGRAGVLIELADGRRITSDEPAGILNRLTHVPRSRVDAVGGEDKDYAAQEMNALFLSWLETLPGPMVNRPTPQGLCGRWRHRSAWALMAAQAGLRAAPYRQSHASDPEAAWIATPRRNSVTVFAVGDAAVAPPGMPRQVLEGCLRLARAAGEALVGVELAPAAHRGWEVASVSPSPDLTLGGEPLIDALARVLTASPTSALRSAS